MNEIEEIYETYNINYAPLAIENSSENIAKSEVKILNKWFKGRGIPNWRKDIENLLFNLGIDSPQELLNKAHGLSLSDQYWIKKEEQANLKWQDINFFTNDFKYKAYLEASLPGDGIIETDGWDGNSSFVTTTSPVFSRGHGGFFGYYRLSGGALNYLVCRAVVVCAPGL